MKDLIAAQGFKFCDSRQASDADDVLPTTPPSSPRVSAGPIQRRATIAAQVSQITRDPVLVGVLMGDLLKLEAIKDGIGAFEAARVALVTGNREAFVVELRMALRCAQEALEASE